MFEAQGPFEEVGWDGVWTGEDPEYGMPFEVLAGLWSKAGAPTQKYLKKAHKKRLGSRAIPLAVFAYDKNGKAWLFGPSTDAGVIELSKSQGQRLLQSALNEPDASAARTLLLRGRDALAEHGDAGVLLQGLFSDQQILRGLPRESGWQAACERGAYVLAGNHRDIDLVRALGYQHKEIAGDALLLSLGGEPPRAVAILLRSSEAFDAAGARFSKSPIYHGLEIARRNNVPWLVVARGSEIRLYPTSPSVGVGRRGATQTYFGLDLALIDETKAGYLDLAFSAKALAPNGSVDQILNDSKTYVAALSSRLRDRVYEDVVSRLSVAVAEKLRDSGPLDADRLALAYRLTLKILFRLLFQAYAEDIRVLPFQRNERYTAASLKQLARHMVEEPNQADSPKSTSLFDGLVQVWRVIDHGDPDWGVPAYNGGLFGTDPTLHPDGAAIERLKLTNNILGPALRGLLVDVAQDGTFGPVDFRSLDVRDFGTIYEGLLEAGISIAEKNLADDGNGGWIAAEKGEPVLVKKTHPYFHTKSGDRKATGSYFTPSFVVEHLLEKSLDPALDLHLARIEELLDTQGDQVGAARAFFNFRVADLAMGSGHFLVAAISHIEQKFGSFLEQHPIPGVEKELIDLHMAATRALSAVGVTAEADRSGLLGRQIAKRCIYGLDINEIAVDLARLAIWVRTFVPGLPMSSLDHQLVWGNSLTGIGTVQEALDILSSGEELQTSGGEKVRIISYAEAPIQAALEAARTALEDAATLKESTSEEVHITQQQMARAFEASRPAREIMDAALAVKLGLIQAPLMGDLQATLEQASQLTVSAKIANLRPAHFPALFPEVFLRDPSGFDVVIGNPPWEEMIVEPRNWWARYIPGLRALSPEDRDRAIEEYGEKVPALLAAIHEEIQVNEATRALLSGRSYPGMGKSNPDLYQAFAWRNWHLMRAQGHSGLVLPRAAFSGSALSDWRKHVIANGQFQQVVFLTNNREWVFENIHPQITVGLVAFLKGDSGPISILGPFFNLAEFQSSRNESSHIEPEVFLTWSNGAAFPLLGSAKVVGLYEKLRSHKRFAETTEYQFVALDEMNGTTDRPKFSKARAGEKTIPVWTGASFDIWNPDAGKPYAVGDWLEVTELLLERARHSAKKKNSAFYGRNFKSIDDHPVSRCRISFRRTTNATNTRTTIACLIPPGVALVNSSPYLVRTRGEVVHEAFVLGVMSSLPFDWQARRVVELGFSAEILNSMALPPFEANNITKRIVEIAGSLAAVDARYVDWATAVGVGVRALGSLDVDDTVAELDALVALAYGLSATELSLIFETFHRGWDSSKSDYVNRLSRVGQHFDVWAAKA